MNAEDPNAPLNFPDAPSWSLIVGEAGRFFVFAAVILLLLSVVAWWRSGKSPKLEKLGKIGFLLGCLSLFGAFVSLASLFINEQFQFQYVAGHSEANLAMKYRIAAIWSGQQGSFLLWACTSAFFGLLAAPRTGIYRRWFTIPYAVFLASLGGILAYETPFNIIPDAIRNGHVMLPPTGFGLVPALQNYWVVIHPPTIFMGFGSLTVLFCWAMSAMVTGNSVDWVRMVRPWALTSLAVLGLGLCMGGFWAYETLGWGGFWAWDPVENVSFVPWVFTAAFVHGLIIQAARGRYIGGNLLLGGLPFLFFVYGTFLTRSGFLGDSSVHSFAEMNRMALWILLLYFGIGTVAFLVLWFKKGRRIATETEKPDTETGPNREALYRTGILLLTGIALFTAIGMSVPVFTLFINGRNSRPEEWLYHQVLSWVFIPVMLLVGLVPFASWRNMTWKALLLRVLNVVTVSVGLTGFALLAFKNPSWGIDPNLAKTSTILGKVEVPTLFWVAFLIFLTLFAAISNIWRMIETLRKSPMSIGGFVAHLGISIFMAGMILSRGFESHQSMYVQRSRPAQALGYTISLPKNPDPEKLTDRDNKLDFNLTSPNHSFVAHPGFYYTQSEDSVKAMTWPHIERLPTHDVYLALGAPVMNVWEKPLFFLPGQTLTKSGITVTFHGFDMKGQPGQAGTKFVGKFTISDDNGTYEVTPSIALTQDGMQPDMPPAGNEFRAMMSRIDAGTKGAELTLLFREALYPIDLYYKPMTSLVWGGAGILTLGGLLAAFYRRVRRTAPETADEATPEGVASPPKQDALIPVS